MFRRSVNDHNNNTIYPFTMDNHANNNGDHNNNDHHHNNNNSHNLTASSTPRHRAGLNRSASMGFTPARSTDVNKKTLKRKSCLRFTPYSIPKRRSSRMLPTSQRSRSSIKRQQSLVGDKSQYSIVETPTMRRSLSIPKAQRYNESVSQFDTDSKNIRNVLREKVSSKTGRSSILDVTSRLKSSLTIGRNDAMSKNSDDHIPMYSTHRKESTHNRAMHHVANGTVENDSCDDFFTPSLDDEFCFPQMLFPDLNGDNSPKTLELTGERQPSDLDEIENGFVDDETVVGNLRKADTVELLDEVDGGKENYCFDSDCSFPLPRLPRPSCEGHEAKLVWGKLQEYSHDEFIRGDDYSPEDEPLQHFDLDEILSNDWLNRSTSLMMSRPSNYTDLAQMQGTYTCSVCGTNLEVDPFSSMDVLTSMTLSSFNGSYTPRSNDCDVTLFCPSCSSNRVIFHADRLCPF